VFILMRSYYLSLCEMMVISLSACFMAMEVMVQISLVISFSYDLND